MSCCPLGAGEGVDEGGAPPPSQVADRHMVAMAQVISMGAELLTTPPLPANNLSTSWPYVLQFHGGFLWGATQSIYVPRVPQCLFPCRNWNPHPLSRKRVCGVYLREPPKGGGTHSAGGEGVGKRQFGRLEKKHSTLSTYSAGCYEPFFKEKLRICTFYAQIFKSY